MKENLYYNVKMMRNKILLSIGILFFCGALYASDEVYLDLNLPEIYKYDTGKLQYENRKLKEEDDENYLKPSFQTMKNMFVEDFYSEKKFLNKE